MPDEKLTKNEMIRIRRKSKQPDQSEKKSKMKDPEPNSEDFIYGEIDQFHRNKDKILLDPSKEDRESEIEEDEDEEVLRLNDSDNMEETSEDNEDDVEEVVDDESNMEEQMSSSNEDEDVDGLPIDTAWGKSKRSFYNADVCDEDIYATDEEAEIAAAEEGKIAMTLQRRMAERLDEDDFYVLQDKVDDEESGKVKDNTVVKNISKLSKREKLEILAKEAPELLPLLDEFKERLTEVKEKYHPVLKMARKGLVLSKEGVQFIQMKHDLLMNYLVNISFYLALKTSKENIKGHPVFDTLVYCRQLFTKIEPLDQKLAPEIDTIIMKYQNGDFEEGFTAIKDKETEHREFEAMTVGKTTRREKATDVNKRKEKIDPLEYYDMIKRQNQHVKLTKKEISRFDKEENELDEPDEDGKRKITYEMSQNKGLIRKRRKELKNPRVKHKMKFKKAKIKHKGQVREVRRETERYGGETTGIKVSLARSVRIK